MDPFLDRLQTAKTLGQVQDLVVELRDDLGVTHAIYHVVGDTGREYGALTYDPAWVDHYVDNAYFRVDPVVQTSLQSIGPVDWQTLDWAGTRARALMGEAVDGGVGKQGLSIPVRGASGQFAMFSVTSYDDARTWDIFRGERLSDLVLAGYFLHQKAAQIMGEDGRPPVDLSPRERDALSHLAAGRSRSETAERLQISEHTLRVYIDSARRKLGALNTVHTVALALMQGLLAT